jgi:hypothetical protein
MEILMSNAGKEIGKKSVSDVLLDLLNVFISSQSFALRDGGVLLDHVFSIRFLGIDF